jgi:ADP-ribose pyrophosphatase YjhB (NUDIX family)
MGKPIIVASGPVIIENNKVLLNKHGDDGYWKFVGGKAESYDNSLEEIAKREVMEEMGIEVDLIRPLKPMMINLSEKVVILIHYLAVRKGEVSPGEDILEWNWFDVNNLPEDCAPNIKPVIDEYLASKQIDKET